MPEVPEFDQVVEYVTEGSEGDGPVVHFVVPHQLSLDVLLTLKLLQEGYEHAAALGRTLALPPEGVEALRTAAAESYHADVISHEIVSNRPAEVVDRLIVVRSYPEWHRSAVVAAGEVWFYGGNLYRCVQAHTVDDAAWTPSATPALWKRYYEPDEIPAWVQPTGAHDAYNVGDRVSFAGNVYESAINANVWSPAVYPAGWRLIGPA